MSSSQERSQPAATPSSSKKKKDSKQKIYTGYILYSSDVRKAIIDNNPESTFGEISRIVGNEWRSLPTSTKQSWEERAAKRNEETSAARLAEEMRESSQHKPMEMTYECAWSDCDYQFEDLQDCMEHCTGDEGNTGHVQNHYRGSFSDYPCLWRNCARVRNGKSPFPNLPRLLRHVRDLHVNKRNGKIMPIHERSRNFIPSKKKPPKTYSTNFRSGVMSPGGTLSNTSGSQAQKQNIIFDSEKPETRTQFPIEIAAKIPANIGEEEFGTPALYPRLQDDEAVLSQYSQEPFEDNSTQCVVVKTEPKYDYYVEKASQTDTIANVQNAITQMVNEKNHNNLKQANDSFGVFVARELSNIPQIKRRQIMLEIIRLFELRAQKQNNIIFDSEEPETQTQFSIEIAAKIPANIGEEEFGTPAQYPRLQDDEAVLSQYSQEPFEDNSTQCVVVKTEPKYDYYVEKASQTDTIANVQNAITQMVNEKNHNNLKQANDSFGVFVARELSNIPQIKRRQIMLEIIRLFDLRGN